MSYSVLLVDDEELVYQVMIKKMNWQELGFHIEGYAHNGIEALEMAEELIPDVVMTDIKMPYMDGLTLARRLKELYPNIKIIILSGFDDFEYAKEAIKLEVEEYILKPIDSRELADVFTRVRNTLDAELDSRRNMDKLQEYYQSSLPLLKDNFFISLIEGRLSADEISRQAGDLQINLKGPGFICGIFRIAQDIPEEENTPQFIRILAVKRLLEEQLGEQFDCTIITYITDIVIFLQLEDMTLEKTFTDVCDKLCKMVKRICNVTVTAGIGACVNAPFNIGESYSGAKRALTHSVIYGNMRAINITEIESRGDTTHRQWEVNLADSIIKNIRLGDKEALKACILNFSDSVRREDISISDYRVRLMKLTARLLEFIESYDIEMNSIVDNDLDLLTNLYEQSSSQGLENYLYEVCSKIMSEISSKRQDSTASFVSSAIQYVKEHFSDKDLNIDTMCRVLNVSAAYFSAAFKKSTGKTFISYLTDWRMEQAVILLETGDKKAYEIADDVGYGDPNYFSYVFKKKFGISPSKYRDK